MRHILAGIVTSLVLGNSVFADCVITQPFPSEIHCDIEIEYGDEVREGLLIWGSGLEIIAPGIYFQDHVSGQGTGEVYYGMGLGVGYRASYGIDGDGFLEPENSLMVDGEPATGFILMEQFDLIDTTIFGWGGWDRNGTPVTITLESPLTTVPEPSAFLLLGVVALLKFGFDRAKNRMLDPQHRRLG